VSVAGLRSVSARRCYRPARLPQTPPSGTGPRLSPDVQRSTGSAGFTSEPGELSVHFVLLTDQFVQPPDQFVRMPDQFVQLTDQFVLVPGHLVQRPGHFVLPPDQFVRLTGQFVPLTDHFVMLPDRFVQASDQFVPAPDRFVRLASQSVPVASQFVPPTRSVAGQVADLFARPATDSARLAQTRPSVLRTQSKIENSLHLFRKHA
jgi:hypothetical protein